MNDLIERLKPYLQGMRVYADIPTTQIPIELLEKTITTLREQEKQNKELILLVQELIAHPDSKIQIVSEGG
jgi:hypothetical protein